MYQVFTKLLNMSMSAGILVIAVVMLRVLLKKVPKKYICILWALVALRLICPISISSSLSVFNLLHVGTDVTGQVEYFQYNGKAEKPKLVFDMPTLTNDSAASDSMAAQSTTSDIFLPVVMYLWLVGTAVMLVLAIISYRKLKKEVAASIRCENNIYICDEIRSPFILGMVSPRIYLPSGMNEATQRNVIAHETAHLKRRDYWWKPLGYILLSLYWYNPILWVAYILLCRDIEAACDERVVAGMDKATRVEYSEALLACAAHRRMITACPVAFGETDVKGRVKNVLKYKKPTFWIISVAIVACIVVAVCFLTNPSNNKRAAIDLEANLESFIHQCIMDYNEDIYYHEEDAYANESHTIVGTENEDNKITVYAWVLYQRWELKDGKAVNISGGHIPTAITVERLAEDSYQLVEYWEAGDGNRYISDIEEKFPKSVQKALWAEEISQARFDRALEDAERFYGLRSGDESDNADTPSTRTLQATVTKIENSTMLVKPVEGSWELNSSDVFSVPIKNMDSSKEPQVGDMIEILYGGGIAEIYPAELQNIVQIRVIENTIANQWYALRDYPINSWELAQEEGFDFWGWRDVSNPPEDLLKEFTTEELVHLSLTYPLLPYMPQRTTDVDSELFCATFEGYSTIFAELLTREDRHMCILNEYASSVPDMDAYNSGEFTFNQSIALEVVVEAYVWTYSKTFTDAQRQYYLDIVQEKHEKYYSKTKEGRCAFGLSFDPDGTAYRKGYDGR